MMLFENDTVGKRYMHFGSSCPERTLLTIMI
jgi:hypothetical protein